MRSTTSWRSSGVLIALLVAVCGALLVAFVAFGQRSPTETNQQQRLRRAALSDARSTTVNVRQGDSLQAALERARPGDTLVLEAGATFTGTFTLPAKPASQSAFITVRSAALERLPVEGVRVAPAHADLMPKITTPANDQPAIVASSGAHHYRFVGIEFKPRNSALVITNLIILGSDTARTAAELPHNIVFDRCLIRVAPEQSARRGIAMNARAVEVANSYLANFKAEGADAQALCAWNTPGPFRIINNYIEAAGENLMFGGGDSSTPELVPADIEIRGNHFTKPLVWRGGRWVVKNLLELKSARRVLIEDNLFEHSWAAAQNGFAILFTPRNQDGAAAWSGVEDVAFRRNVVRHANNGISLLATDYIHPSRSLRNITIEHNLFYDIDNRRWGAGGGGVVLQFDGAGADRITFAHNTADHTGNSLMFESNARYSNLIVADNIIKSHIGGDGLAGAEVVAKFARSSARVNRNVIIMTEARAFWEPRYPPRNFIMDSYDQLRFANRATGDYRLRPDSPIKGRATDNTDIGVDYASLNAALSAAK